LCVSMAWCRCDEGKFRGPILDWLGVLCVQVDVGLSDGSFARGAVPSGASTGTFVLIHPA
jgi:enolase